MFRSENEFRTFDFSQSYVVSVKIDTNKVFFVAGDVIIKEANSNNREFFSMGTDELQVSLLDMYELKVIKDGYKLYDANNKLLESYDDETIEEGRYEEITKLMKGCFPGEVSKDGEEYILSVDVDDLVSYTIICKAKKDICEWENFRKIPQELR